MKRRHIHESMTWPLQSCKIHRYEYAAEDVTEVGTTPAWCLHTLFPGSVNRSSPAAIECTSFFSVWAQCKQLVRKLHLCCTCTWCRRHFSSLSSQWKIIEFHFSWTYLSNLLLYLQYTNAFSRILGCETVLVLSYDATMICTVTHPAYQDTESVV